MKHPKMGLKSRRIKKRQSAAKIRRKGSRNAKGEWKAQKGAQTGEGLGSEGLADLIRGEGRADRKGRGQNSAKQTLTRKHKNSAIK